MTITDYNVFGTFLRGKNIDAFILLKAYMYSFDAIHVGCGCRLGSRINSTKELYVATVQNLTEEEKIFIKGSYGVDSIQFLSDGIEIKVI